MTADPFRLGTRGSALARTQAKDVKEAIERHRETVELVEVSTTGDRIPDERIAALGRTGAFVRDLDERVLAGDLNGAVHSLKDMPTEMPDELVVAAIPERAAAHDVLVTPDGATLESLPTDAVVGTGSMRRQAQVLSARPDLTVVPIRGNVDTRLAKLLAPTIDAAATRVDEDPDEDFDDWIAELHPIEAEARERDPDPQLDAIVLAAAGLQRSGLENVAETVQLESWVPAAGQGALALTMRDGEAAARLQQRHDHPPTRVAVTVERVILAELNGGCLAPIGVHAVVQGEVVRTRVQVLAADGSDSLSVARDLPVEDHVSAARDLADELVADGAAELIEAAKTDPGDRA